MPSTPEQLLREKCKKFEVYAQEDRWDDLVSTCYAPDASLTHFAAPDTLIRREAIKGFFANCSGYSLNLQFTVVKLDTTAYLVAGVGSVKPGAWCPFFERWETRDGEWFIVKDKICPAESWME